MRAEKIQMRKFKPFFMAKIKTVMVYNFYIRKKKSIQKKP